MRYRRLDENGDYIYGNGSADFLTGVEAVAQAIQTSLQLYTGDFWRDLTAGFPLWTQILATSGSDTNRQKVDGIIQGVIAGVQGVKSLSRLSTTWDPNIRQYGFVVTVDTIYGETVIQSAFG